VHELLARVHLLQQAQGGCVFDAFSDDVHAHVLGQRNDRADDFDVLGSFADAAHERAINLQSINREAMQIPERGITGAKIVDA